MWTTSSSRVDALLLLLAVGCASARAPQEARVAPDAPQPAIEEHERRPPTAEPKYARIELASVRVRRLDDQLARLAGPQFVRTARDPVAIEATTTSALPPPLGASSPALIINGQLYPDTWYVGPNRLIAFIEDRASLRANNTAEAVWIGTGDSTRSSRPFPFSPDIQ